MRILIFVNLPQRDQATDELLASKLRANGHEVRVAPYLPRNREHILFFKPDMVIGPEPRCEYTIAMYKQCMEWGVYAIAKRTEGGAAKKSYEVMIEDEKKTVIGTWPYDVDLEICWSNDFVDILKKDGYLPENKIFAAGALPFDVYFQPPYRQRPEGRKNLIFATGWGHADTNPEYNIPEAPPGSPLHRDAYERHRKGRDAWIELIRRAHDELAKEGFDIFLRMKVGEKPIEYQQKLAGKVKIIIPCDTKTCLLNTDILVHAGSTMALEADLCNIPAISFLGSLNQPPGYEYPHVSKDYDNIDDVIKAIREVQLDKSNANKESIAQLEKDFYGTIDGKATDRIVEKLLSLPKRPVNIPDEWPADKPIYNAGNVYPWSEQWMCETCRHICYVPKKDGEKPTEMIKCPWCGISLARKAMPQMTPQAQIKK